MESSQPISPGPGDTASPAASDYPLTFAVDYPDRDLDRLSTAFRIIWIIPIAILAASERPSTTSASASPTLRTGRQC